MAINWDKFDESVDLDGLKKDVAEAAENTGEYPDIPPGEYEVALKALELGETKENPRPMVKGQFKIVEGEYKNQLIFYNALVTEGWQIKRVNAFLQSLDTGIAVDFDSYKQYASLMLDIAEAADGNAEYLLDYGQTKSGFPTFNIKEVYDLD